MRGVLRSCEEDLARAYRRRSGEGPPCWLKVGGTRVSEWSSHGARRAVAARGAQCARSVVHGARHAARRTRCVVRGGERSARCVVGVVSVPGSKVVMLMSSEMKFEKIPPAPAPAPVCILRITADEDLVWPSPQQQHPPSVRDAVMNSTSLMRNFGIVTTCAWARWGGRGGALVGRM